MSFDPNSFLQTAVEGAIDTTIIPVPPDSYTGIIDSLKAREVTTDDGPQIVLDVTWRIEDEGVQKHCKRKKVTVRQGVFLETTAEGSLDMSEGSNRQLGLLLEAIGMNKKGRKWSFEEMKEQSALITVEHKENPKDPESPFANVTRVAPLV